MTPPLSLHVERIVPATPQQIFDVWTTPSELAKWWAPPGGRCVSASVDLHVGGRYTIVNELPGGITVSIQGEYLVIERPTLLMFTWTTGDPQSATETVTVSFQADGEQTKVGIEHVRLPSQEVAESHTLGWKSCLNGLVQFVTVGSDR